MKIWLQCCCLFEGTKDFGGPVRRDGHHQHRHQIHRGGLCHAGHLQALQPAHPAHAAGEEPQAGHVQDGERDRRQVARVHRAARGQGEGRPTCISFTGGAQKCKHASCIRCCF